ncbi:MAG: MBOAT family O-acyltransferase, partial [Acidimicrobiales bacterium]
GGLWHGAACRLVLWGGLHGAGLAAERLWDSRGNSGPSGPAIASGSSRAWVRRIVTFHVVCLGWIFFRAGSVGAAFDVLGRIVFGESVFAINPVVVAVVAGMLAAQYVSADTITGLQDSFARWSVAAQAGAISSIVLAVDVLGPTGVAPFIYFQF